jgi:hypothetical protein
MFIQQSGTNRHEHVCQSLEVFAERVMPEFKQRDAVREAEKRRDLAPYIEAALARKPKMAPLDEAAIPRIEAFGRKAPSPLLNSDRGGAIPIPTQDPLAAREAARPLSSTDGRALAFSPGGRARISAFLTPLGNGPQSKQETSLG